MYFHRRIKSYSFIRKLRPQCYRSKMSNTEGLALVFVLIAVFLVVFGGMVLIALHGILKRTTNPIVLLGVPVSVLLLGFILLMGADSLAV